MPRFPVDPGSVAHAGSGSMLGMQDLGDVGCSVDPCRMDWPMLSNDGLLNVHHLYGAKHLGAALQRAQETAASAEGSWLHT